MLKRDELIQRGYSLETYRGNPMVRGITQDTRGRAFTVTRWNDGRYVTSLLGARKRVTLKDAIDEDGAIMAALEYWFPTPKMEEDAGLFIAEVMVEFLDSLCVAASTYAGYKRRLERMALFFADLGIVDWKDLRSKHLSAFVKTMWQEGYARDEVQSHIGLLKSVSAHVLENHEDHYRPIGAKNPIPPTVRVRKNRWQLHDAVDFCFFVADQPCGHHILAGLVLSVVCGFRIEEVRAMKKSRFDAYRGTVHNGDYVKRKCERWSDRVVPLPQLVIDILEHTLPKVDGEFMMATRTKDTSAQSFERYLERWRPGFRWLMKDCRNILASEFKALRKYSGELQAYRGHRPTAEFVGGVDLDHYIDTDPQEVIQSLREAVTVPLDGILAGHLDRWRGTAQNVVKMARQAV